MGFYKTTLPKDIYSNIYIDAVRNYCQEANIMFNNKIITSIVLWMIRNGYITPRNEEDIEHDPGTVFGILRWKIETIIDSKRPYDPHYVQGAEPTGRIFDTFIRNDNGIWILPGINCTKGKKDIISERFDTNINALRTIFEKCGFEFKQRGSKFKGQAYIYDIKKKI